MTTATYIVNGSADDLAGWTCDGLAAALRAPLAALGVEVEIRPREHGSRADHGLTIWADMSATEEDMFRLQVTDLVERVIQDGEHVENNGHPQ